VILMGKMNVLAIGAHFDDIECGCGGTIAKHILAGDDVTMLVVSDSAYFDRILKHGRTKEQALREGNEGAKILGVKNLKCLEYKGRVFEVSLKLVEDLEAIIRELKIDTVYTHWIHDVHQDHSTISRATLTAARYVPRLLMYQSNWYIPAKIFNGNFYVDISDVINKKIEAIKAHLSEYKRKGEEKWIDFIITQNHAEGVKLGKQYAEVFEIVRYLKEN